MPYEDATFQNNFKDFNNIYSFFYTLNKLRKTWSIHSVLLDHTHAILFT